MPCALVQLDKLTMLYFEGLQVLLTGCFFYRARWSCHYQVPILCSKPAKALSDLVMICDAIKRQPTLWYAHDVEPGQHVSSCMAINGEGRVAFGQICCFKHIHLGVPWFRMRAASLLSKVFPSGVALITCQQAQYLFQAYR